MDEFDEKEYTVLHRVEPSSGILSASDVRKMIQEAMASSIGTITAGVNEAVRTNVNQALRGSPIKRAVVEAMGISPSQGSLGTGVGYSPRVNNIVEKVQVAHFMQGEPPYQAEFKLEVTVTKQAALMRQENLTKILRELVVLIHPEEEDIGVFYMKTDDSADFVVPNGRKKLPEATFGLIINYLNGPWGIQHLPVDPKPIVGLAQSKIRDLLSQMLCANRTRMKVSMAKTETGKRKRRQGRQLFPRDSHPYDDGFPTE